MEEGILDFCEIQVLLKGTDIFLLFLRGSFEISLTKGGIKSCIYEGTMPLFTSYMKYRSVYMCFVVNCRERADLLALVCGVYCEFVTFPLVSWVRCGT